MLQKTSNQALACTCAPASAHPTTPQLPPAIDTRVQAVNSRDSRWSSASISWLSVLPLKRVAAASAAYALSTAPSFSRGTLQWRAGRSGGWGWAAGVEVGVQLA